ncbi:MAG: methylenetetrahydrofolate reductase [NAD(P)H] [Lachnospiraceae bacterium]|jgi:methylenetetrahydrofolate reductase (NADPH)|nr:methylenetetrahydrofolate reductase [NAD(P)H] [Lachnospiraceae bacterium]
MLPVKNHSKTTLSFEVYPPKHDEEFPSSYRILDSLSKLNPDFISVTYGAGGSRSKKTVEIASYIQNQLRITALAHMTCVGNKKEDILKVTADLRSQGISHILALRGDRPKDMSDEQYESREFAFANDMIAFLREKTDFHIAAACYPEKHYECFSMESDLLHLKKKQDAGAEFLITQLFFDNDCFYRFREQAAKKGITIPICVGIMPITSSNQIRTSVTLSGSSIPKPLADLLAKYGDYPDQMREAGIEYAIRQILDLKQNGVDGIHLYVMNRPKMTAQIVTACGI